MSVVIPNVIMLCVGALFKFTRLILRSDEIWTRVRILSQMPRLFTTCFQPLPAREWTFKIKSQLGMNFNSCDSKFMPASFTTRVYLIHR